MSNSLGNSFGNRFGNWGGSSDTPYTIFGAALIHEWDLGLSTVQVSTGISSISDLRGGKDLTQGTGSKQPAFTPAGLVSKSTSTAASSHALNASGFTALGGDVTLLLVGGYTLVSAAYLATCGNKSIILSNSGNWRGTVDDATGADNMAGAAADTSPHAIALVNDTGVLRKFWVDGGAGTAGARTDDADANTTFGLHANNNGLSSFSNSAIYWVGIVRPSPSLADLNRWGAWAAARFTSVGVTWSTAT